MRKNALLLFLLLLPLFQYPKGISVEIKTSSYPSMNSIDTSAEYANGSISTSIGSIWYAWVNVTNTQVIYYSLYSDQVNSPIVNFLGQCFQTQEGNDVFIGHTLTLMEVYNDTNHDGVPQANFTSGESEISYYLLINSSVGYEVTPIEKTIEDPIPHYRWGFKYESIDGFLLRPEEQPGYGVAKVMIDHLGFYYDFSVVENTSYLKTTFDIGGLTSIQPLGQTPVTLEGQSLSLLFSTVSSSAKPRSIYVNDQPYNSTRAASSTTSITKGQIAVEQIKVYDFLFENSYNLTRGSGIETHEATFEAAATTSVPQGATSRLDWALSYFEDNLNMSRLFPSASGIAGELSLDYESSAFLYRVCYPAWDGFQIEHDPTYVAYLFSFIEIPEFSSVVILSLFTIVALATAVAYKKLITPNPSNSAS